MKGTIDSTFARYSNVVVGLVSAVGFSLQSVQAYQLLDFTYPLQSHS
jgi:hypothetical protein